MVKRADLLTQLEAVTPGLSSKEIIEQSSCYVFKNGKVITFNDEVSCSIKSCLNIEGAVRSDQLVALLRKMKEDELDISAEDGELKVKGEKKRAGIRMEAKVLLPIEGIEDPKKWVEMPKGMLDGIGIVQSCASRDQSQFKITCVHLHPSYVEACDNFQLARYPVKTGLSERTLVRQSALKHLTGDMVEFGLTDNWLHFRSKSGLTLSCRRYLDTFPDLSPLLEVDGVKSPLPKGLEDAVDKAVVFCAESEDTNYIVVELRSGKCKITGRGPTGWYSEVKEVGYSGEELSFSIHPKLLLEISKRAETVIIGSGRLKVKGDKFVYVTCTRQVKDE